MFVRKLALVLVLGLALAGVTAGISSSSTKGGVKGPGFIYYPPYVKTLVPLACQVHFEATTLEITCHNTAPNPKPPKDQVTVPFPCSKKPPAPGRLTVYPDGNLLLTCRLAYPK